MKRIALAVVLLLGAAAHLRNRVWSDELRFWSDVASKSPRHSGARNNLGTALLRAGRVEDAVSAYRLALELDPTDAEVHNNLGSAQLALGALAPRGEAGVLLLTSNYFLRARHNPFYAFQASKLTAWIDTL